MVSNVIEMDWMKGPVRQDLAQLPTCMHTVSLRHKVYMISTLLGGFNGWWGARKKNSFLSLATKGFLVVCAPHYPDDANLS